MRKLILAVSLIMTVMQAGAQSVISGTVRSSDGNPIGGAVVSITAGTKIIKFGTTSDKGVYRLETNDSGEAEISYSHLSYKKLSLPVTIETQQLDVVLEDRSETLEEVVVSAPVVKLQGDTLSFWLPGLAGKSDYTLEDAMKRIPGIAVAADGRISYLGKSISSFYIDGVDVLGGKYAIATKNIPLEAVQEVEVLKNHQPVKMERGRGRTDEVAVNVKLKQEARLRPAGNTEAGTGAGDEILYRAGGSLMHFGGKAQSVFSAKIGNDRQFALSETSDFFSSSTLGDYASSLTGSPASPVPDISSRYYIRPEDAYASLNVVRKSGDDSEISANVQYAVSRTNYDYRVTSTLYAGEDALVITEDLGPESKMQIPDIKLRYKYNGPQRYLSEIASFTANYMDKSTDGNVVQNKSATLARVRNQLDGRVRIGRRAFRLSSDIAWLETPSAKFAYDGSGYHGYQESNGSRFLSSHSVNTSIDFGRSILYIPLTLRADHDRLSILVKTEGYSSSGSLTATDADLTLSPYLRFTSASRRIEAMARMNLQFRNISSGSERFSRLFANPSGSLYWIPDSRNAFNLSGSYTRRAGDVLDYLTGETLDDYRTLRSRSGIIAETGTGALTLQYDWQRPVELWFAKIVLQGSVTSSNLIGGQSAGGSSMTRYTTSGSNTAEKVSTSMNISKRLQRLRTNVSLTVSHGISQGEMIGQSRLLKILSRTSALGWNLSSDPLKWLSLTYSGTASLSGSKYGNISKSIVSVSQKAKVSVFPASWLQLSASVNHMRHELQEGNFKSMVLANASAEARTGKWKFNLSLNNIPDTRSFSYTIFTGLDTCSYDFSLRGREIMFTVTRTL